MEKKYCTAVVLSLIHISEPTRQAEISYAVFCLKKKKKKEYKPKRKEQTGVSREKNKDEKISKYGYII